MDVVDQLVKEFKDNVEFADFPKPMRPIKPVRIMLDGKYLMLGVQKKTIWKRLGDAKSALRNHSNFKYELFRDKYKGSCKDWKEQKEIAEKAFQQLLSQVTFVEVDDNK